MGRVLRGADPALERLWAAIGPVVGVLPVLEGSDAWIRRGGRRCGTGRGRGSCGGGRLHRRGEGCDVCTAPGRSSK